MDIEAPSDILNILLENKDDHNKIVKGGKYDTNQHLSLYFGGNGSVVKYNGQSQIGCDKKFGIFGEASCNLGNANLGAGLDLNLDKSTLKLGAGVGTNVAEGSVGIGFHIMGYGVSVGMQGSALGFSADAQCGVKNGKLTLELGETHGLGGGGLYLNIGKVH